MNELINWLKRNKIRHNVVDEEVVEIPGMGRVFFQDMDKVNSIFRLDSDQNLVFNCVELPSVLANDDIEYVTFKFGDNWYYTELNKEFTLRILKYVGEREKPEMPVEFVNLGVHTPYELLNGSFMPKDWVKKAKYLGHTALGVCDLNTMASLFSFQKEGEAAEITPVFGYSLNFTCGENIVGGKVYVQSQRGLRNLLRIQKAIMIDSEDSTIDIDTLLSLGEGNVFVFDKYSSAWIDNNRKVVKEFKAAYQDVYYQVDLSEYKAERIDIRVLEAAKYYFDNNLSDVVEPILISDCYYLDQDDAKNKVILNKIASGAAHDQSDDQYFKDVDENYTLFKQLFDSDKWDVEEVFRKCCAPTVKIAQNAKARFETDRNFMPKYDMTEEEKAKYGTSHNMFCQLLEEGLERLIPAEDRDKYRKQMEYEKYIIESTNNVDYLLVQYDTVNWCKKNNILVGCGRGSAAGSLLLYLLGITLIDPIKYDLIFERFLLPERAGLYPSDTTIIGEDIEATEYIQVCLGDSKTINLDKDAELLIRRGDSETPIRVYADELKEGDEILFDNKDEIFTINEI